MKLVIAAIRTWLCMCRSTIESGDGCWSTFGNLRTKGRARGQGKKWCWLAVVFGDKVACSGKNGAYRGNRVGAWPKLDRDKLGGGRKLLPWSMAGEKEEMLGLVAS